MAWWAKRELHGEAGALAEDAFYVDVAAELADVFAAFEDADAHASQAFGGFEGAEQACADKVVVHAAPGVANVDDDPRAVADEADPHLASGGGGLLGILHQ